MNTDQTATQQVLIEYANEVLQLRLEVARLRAEAKAGEDDATEQES